MTKRYTPHYHILGIGPEATWEELRHAYKSLINIWHPDRFQQDSRRRKLAEEKTKEITQSYKLLAEYFKKHGALPPVTENAETLHATEDIVPRDAGHVVTEPEIQEREPPIAAVTPGESPKRRRFKFSSIITVAAVAGAAYLVMENITWESPSNQPQNTTPDENLPAQTAAVQEDPDAKTTKPDKFFSVGASLGEVYTIQGVPTKTVDDVWYYGQSKVYFSKGKVVRWEENPDNPLRAKSNPGDNEMNSQFFGKGSSKNQVLSLQGAPDRDSGNVWDYGTSRVYFENGHVKGWDESPFNPLKVRH